MVGKKEKQRAAIREEVFTVMTVLVNKKSEKVPVQGLKSILEASKDIHRCFSC